MTNRKEINDKVVEWITDKVKREYADDVSLVMLYGSYINGTANSKSDVDFYYIPKTERAYNLATVFIIDGVGYDFYPIPWEQVEKIADLQECMLPLIGDAQIIYCGEYGVIDQAPVEDSLAWIRDLHLIFRKYNVGSALWTYKEMDFGLTENHYEGIRDSMIKIITE